MNGQSELKTGFLRPFRDTGKIYGTGTEIPVQLATISRNAK